MGGTRNSVAGRAGAAYRPEQSIIDELKSRRFGQPEKLIVRDDRGNVLYEMEGTTNTSTTPMGLDLTGATTYHSHPQDMPFSFNDVSNFTVHSRTRGLKEALAVSPFRIWRMRLRDPDRPVEAGVWRKAFSSIERKLNSYKREWDGNSAIPERSRDRYAFRQVWKWATSSSGPLKELEILEEII